MKGRRFSACLALTRSPSVNQPKDAKGKENKATPVAGKLDELRRELNGRATQPLKTASSQSSDVEDLQKSLRYLADAMHEELRLVRSENQKLKTDRETWLMTMRSLQENCNDKIVLMELEKTRVVSELSSIKNGLKDDVARLLLVADEKQRALERQVHDLRVEVRSLKATVEDAKALGSSDFPHSVIAQRLKDKEGVLAMLSEAVKEVAPLAISGAVRAEAPAFVKECVGEEMRLAVELKGEEMRRELREGEERMSLLLSKATIEATESAGEILALQERCQVLETSSSDHKARLQFLEDQESKHPRAIASGLSERFEIMVQKQARYARSMEEVVRALVEDASTIQEQTQAQGASLESHQRYMLATRGGP